MNEYVLTINQKEYRAEVSEINAEFALIQVNGREFRVDLQQLGLGKLMPVATVAAENQGRQPEGAAGDRRRSGPGGPGRRPRPETFPAWSRLLARADHRRQGPRRGKGQRPGRPSWSWRP